MINTECDCSEEFGPCERHGELLAQREGASAGHVTYDDAIETDHGVLVPRAETSYAIEVSLANEGKGGIFGSWTEDLDDLYLRDDADLPDFGAIYRMARREYGRCTSSIYVDTVGGTPRRVGWYFVSRERYEDTGEPYLRGAWVTVIERVPESRSFVTTGSTR